MVKTKVEPKTFGNPHIYKIQDPGCDKSRAVGNFSNKTLVWIADKKGKIKQKEVDLSAFSLHGLKGSLIEDTVYSDNEVNISRGGLIAAEKNKQLLGQKYVKGTMTSQLGFNTLNFCRPKGGYDRESAENVALATLVGLESSQKAYNAHAQKSKLGKIKLIIHPKLYTFNTSGEKVYQVDNASYSYISKPSDGWNHYILAWPHSYNFEAENKLRFWETPAVFGHELGHFIFRKDGENLLTNYDLDMPVSRIIEGLDEGFADLISWYGLGATGSHYRVMHLSDFRAEKDENNYRSLSNPFIPYYTELGKETLDKTISKRFVDLVTSKSDKSDVPEILYQECHHTGAVFAYIWHQLLRERGLEDNPEDSIRLTVRWLSEFSAQNPDKNFKNDPRGFLKAAMTTMVRVASQAENDAIGLVNALDRDDFLRKAKELMPHYRHDLDAIL